MVPESVFGRTNIPLPPIWLSLLGPRQDTPDFNPEAIAQAALDSRLPLDVTAAPGLWGGFLASKAEFVSCVSDALWTQATSERHAVELVQAHLIQTLSAVGSGRLDLYFLRVRNAVEEFQIAGALEAIELARQEGYVRFAGLCCDGSAYGALSSWHFHDAFEVLLVPRNHLDGSAYEVLSPLARERRVGVVGSRPLNWGFGLPFFRLPSLWRLRNLSQSFYGLSLAQAAVADLAQSAHVMVGVRSQEQIRQYASLTSSRIPEGVGEYLQPYIDAWKDPDTWKDLAESDDPLLRAVAERRAKEMVSA